MQYNLNLISFVLFIYCIMTIDTLVQKVKRTQKEQLKFSILIPTWNNLEYLQLCIESIRKNSHFHHQLIIHINEGSDGTLEWIRTQPDINYTHSIQNIGVCYALNIGRSLADTDYIVYLNDDMYVCPGWDLVLWNEIEKIGHRNFFLSSTAIEPCQSHNAVIKMDYGISITDFNEKKLLAEFSSLPFHDWQGATWPPNIVHKDLWDMAGGYSIEFSPGMYSDPDFSMKLWQMGIRLFKGLGESRIYHFGSISIKRVKKNKGYYAFVAKWGITQNIFSARYLRKGELFDGVLQEPRLSLGFKLNNIFKQLKAAFYR
jgi:glycosyltransferase involved in cell wall biosynthesis